MQPHDLELGPIKRAFDELFKSIAEYFNSAPVEPKGTVREDDLSIYSQEKLHETLRSSLDFFGFLDLPSQLRVNISKDSELGGFHRSDNITVYSEKMKDGSIRTFNFYHKYGPERLKASYYFLNKTEPEETRGVLTMENRWYLRVSTKNEHVYYLRIEREKPN